MILGLAIAGVTLCFTPNAFALTWYPGEGIKQGDYYKYNVCWTDWHNCAPLEIDFWVKNQTSDGKGWNLEMLASDGSVIQKGIVSIGTETPDPTYSDPNIADYSNVYKNTIAWLDAFSSKDNAQTLGSPSWGRTGSVGGQSVSTMGKEPVTVTAGTFQTWILGWHKGIDNQIWIDPTLSFPVKAIVYSDVTSGVPPPDYTLELLQQGNSQTEPSFLKVSSSGLVGVSPQCPSSDMVNDAASDTQTTDSGSMILAYRFSPATPHLGCPMEWRISFEKNFDQTQKYSQVQYDIYAVDDSGHQIASVSQDLGRTELFAPVGDDDRTIILKGTTPVTHLVIAVLGVGAEGTSPDVSLSGAVNITLNTLPPFGGTTTGTTGPSTSGSQIVIPSWVKKNAGYWATGQVGDNDFVQGIQYMIQNGIVKIPHGQSGSGNSQNIPSWVKNNAGFWATGQIPDDQFVMGIQYMITNGIIQLGS